MMIQALLVRKLRRNVVLEMALLGERWTAAQLHECGLVNRVVPAGRFDEETASLAANLAEKSAAIIRLGGDAFYRQQDMDFKAALEYLHGDVTLVTLTEDSAEGRQAFSRSASRSSPDAETEVAMDIRAELVGTVWKVLVKAGDTVTEDHELVILESMKMEISVVATRTGQVREVRVKEDDVVAENQILIVVD